MIRLEHCADDIPVWLIDFRADEEFVRQCVTYALKSAPAHHRKHITGVFVSATAYGYRIRYETILEANVGIPEREIRSLKPYRKPGAPSAIERKPYVISLFEEVKS